MRKIFRNFFYFLFQTVFMPSRFLTMLSRPVKSEWRNKNLFTLYSASKHNKCNTDYFEPDIFFCDSDFTGVFSIVKGKTLVYPPPASAQTKRYFSAVFAPNS